MRFFSTQVAVVVSGDPHLIEMNLRDMHQLFNSMDPAPFNDKDLDHDAEEFIVSWVEEFPPDDPVTLRIYLEQWPAENPDQLIPQAVHNYFAYRAKLNQLEFRHLMRQGRTSMGIGLVFLAVCFLAVKFLQPHEASTWAGFLRESFLIAGWVAMWRPMQICLYDWWPIRRRGRTYIKLSNMPVEVIHKEKNL